MITQLIHLTWFLGSELIADLKAKTKSSTPCGSLGTGLPTPELNQHTYFATHNTRFGYLTQNSLHRTTEMADHAQYAHHGQKLRFHSQASH